MKSKKIATIVCVYLLSFFSVAAFAESLTDPILPEIPGWQNGVCKVAALDTVSGNHGLWAERSYRTDDGGAFKAIWMGGKGPALLYPPASGLRQDDGPIGAGATYETLRVGENLAILESHPVLGCSLALSMPDGMLTLESGAYGMGKEQILEAAETLAAQIGSR